MNKEQRMKLQEEARKNKSIDNPLMEAPVIRKGRNYTKANVVLEDNIKNSEIPIPDYTRPKLKLDNYSDIANDNNIDNNVDNNSNSNSNSNTDTTQENTTEKQTVNKEQNNKFTEKTNTLPLSERKEKAKRLANIVVKSYTYILNIGYDILNYENIKLSKLIDRKKINAEILNTQLIINEDGESRTLLELINDYNEQLKTTLSIDTKFEQDAVSLLSEIFLKKGIGISPESELLIMFGIDIFDKSIRTFRLRSSINYLINSISVKMNSNKYGGNKEPEITTINKEPVTVPKKDTEKENIDVEKDIQQAENIDNSILNTSEVEEMKNYNMVEPEEK